MKPVCKRIASGEELPVLPALVVDEIQRRLGVLKRCQDAINQGVELDAENDTPGRSEWLAVFAVRDEASSASGWITRMSFEADRLGIGEAFRAVVRTVPNAVLTLSVSDAAKVQGGMLS